MVNWIACQHTVEKLRPFVGFAYPLLKKVAPTKLKVISQPSTASFLMNNRCNARCGFCMVGDYFQDKYAKELTLDKFKIIANNIHLQTFHQVWLSGAGEPLLNPNTIKIIRWINATYPHIDILTTTNGIALNKERAQALAETRLRLLSISVNAASRDVYKTVMQVDQFDQVVENTRYYQQLTKGKLKHPQLSFVAHRKNIEDLPEFAKLGISLGVKLIVVRYARFYPSLQRQQMAQSADSLLDDSDSLFFHQELSDKCVREAQKICQNAGIEFKHTDPLFSEPEAKVLCCSPMTEVLIGMDGEVFPCCGKKCYSKRR